MLPVPGNRERLCPGACSLWRGDKAQSNEDLVFCFSFCEVSEWPQLRSAAQQPGLVPLQLSARGLPSEMLSEWHSRVQGEKSARCRVSSMWSQRVIIDGFVKGKSSYRCALVVTAKE